MAAAVIGVVALGGFAAWQHRLHPPLSGDEPGYIVVAESLWFDHDTNLANNFGANARINTALINPVGPAATVRIESPTNWRPTQPVGMGVLLTPAVAIGHRGAAELQWARRLMMLIAALLLWQMFELLADQVALGLAVAITGAVALAFPLVGYSNQIYPEIPAALLFTIGLRGVLGRKRLHPVWVGLAAAALPWLSVRYTLLAIGLVVAVLVRSYREHDERQLRPALIAGSLLAAGIAVMLIVDSNVHHIPRIAQSAINTYRVGVGGLFSPVFGLLPYAPQLAVGVVGLGLVWKLQRGAGAAVVVGALGYELVAIPFGFRGYALPGRFQIVLVPLLALGIARLLDAYPRLLAIVAGATVLGVVILVQAGSQPTYGSLYLDPPRPTLGVLKPVAKVLPGFALAPGHTGVVITGSRLASEPPVALRRGTYELTLRADPQSATRARVVVESDASGAMRTVADVSRSLSARGTIAFPLDVGRSGAQYRFRADASDGPVVGEIQSLSVLLTAHGESRTAPSERGVPLGIAWIALTLALTAVATRFRRST